MPDIEISKIKARRGTDEQRKLIAFDQGEFAYTLDTKRLYVGDGVTFGGNVAGNKIHDSILNYYSLSTIVSEVGDIVTLNGTLYKLLDDDYTNINNWERIRLDVDPIIFTFDSSDTLYVNSNSISANYLDPTTISNGIILSGGILQSNFITKSLEISAYKLSIKASGIDERELNTTAFINGLSGGSGSKIGIKSNPDYFYYDTSGLNLSGFNPFTLRFQDLNSDWFGLGLNYNSSLSTLSATITDLDDSNTLVKNLTGGIGINTSIFGTGLYYNTDSTTLSTNIVDVDGISLVRDDLGSINIANDAISGTNQLAQITVDQFGRVISQTSSIFGTLTGNSTLSSFNSSNSLSSIFNGTPSHTLSGAIPGLQITKFTALSSNGTVITLSSAGFITFEGNTTTRNGGTVGRFAIPIFAY